MKQRLTADSNPIPSKDTYSGRRASSFLKEAATSFGKWVLLHAGPVREPIPIVPDAATCRSFCSVPKEQEYSSHLSISGACYHRVVLKNARRSRKFRQGTNCHC